jgi:transcriptional regulator with XRE-family HTH domain
MTWVELSIEKLSIKRELKLVTIRQIKAARALLGWSQGDLAQHSSISEPTIARLESVDGPVAGRPKTADKIRGALEKAGIQFIDENGGGPGVRLRRRQRAKK